MKNVGIWMDKKRAFIVTNENQNQSVVEIASEVDDYRISGGSGTRMKGGPQDVVHDSKYLENEKHQMRRYFQKLIPYIKDANQFIILGPAQAGNKFAKELSENYPRLHQKLMKIQKADNMTENQLKAKVRETFEMIIEH